MSVLAPRAVLVHRRTELDELLERHGTRGQVEFFLRQRGRTLAEVDARHAAQAEALRLVGAALPVGWRRGSVERSDLTRFLFSPEDLVVVVGQDGLVANTAKYLDAQPVLGVAPCPVGPGVLVPHSAAAAAQLLARDDVAQLRTSIELRVMAEARTDDGQALAALNEVYVGHASHQSARYELALPDGRAERQSSSGVLVSTGTGATGWCRSVLAASRSTLTPPAPTAPELVWMVREAWPSPTSGATLMEGVLAGAAMLQLRCTSDRLVVFGDGMEDDHLDVGWGQTVTVGVAARRLHLVR